jgi:hypothetical protein
MRINFTSLLFGFLVATRYWFSSQLPKPAHLILDFLIVATLARRCQELQLAKQKKKEQDAERKNGSENDYSVEEWMKRGRFAAQRMRPGQPFLDFMGEELEIWYDRREPTSIVPQRFLDWQFYPILIPPLLLLFIFARRAWRSSGPGA